MKRKINKLLMLLFWMGLFGVLPGCVHNANAQTKGTGAKPGKKAKLPKAIFKKNPTKKEKKKKISYKQTGWISGGSKSQRKNYKLGDTYPWTRAGTMTLYPVFTKMKK